MTNSEIIEKINSFLIEEFEVDGDKITPEANLKETLQIDSLDYVDLVVLLESNFHFKLQPADLQNIETFEHFYDYVIERAKTT